VNNGDVVALVGRNGSGKSTLLRGIAGLLRPSDGSITTRGRVILLAGVNPGFSMEATGRENMLELGRAYGVSNTELHEFSQSIIDFADIGDAIDRRVKGYSGGMKGKLGFGFITALRPDVLLIDETLGVGDEEFQAKARDRLRKFVASSGAVIMSTHSLGLARELCNRGLVIDRGKIVADAEIEDAMLAYRGLLKG
jgi:ABC-type polysaccharide/polyol phosphate transport system ATPase subunit